MRRLVLHLDIDAFLASVEQIVEPSLRGRPVAVGSGVVASRSYEAKARGVTTAMPIHEARRRCPELIVRDGDARLADRFRQRVATVLRQFAPLVQVCSLDDMYADLTGVALIGGSAVAHAEAIREAVRGATDLSVSQGLGPSKITARLATKHAKPGGVREIAAAEASAFAGAHALEELPGIGDRTRELLEQWNLTTVADLQALDRGLLRHVLGQRGETLYWRARGLDCDPLGEPDRVQPTPPVQSISRETSFEAVAGDAAGRPFLLGMLSYLLDRATSELRVHDLVARTVTVRVRHVDGVGQEKSRSRKPATARHDCLFAIARDLLHELLERRVLVRLVGVPLTAFEPAPRRQLELFADETLRRVDLYRAVDRVRDRHGFGKLVLGEAAALLGKVTNTEAGFRLRTPSLTK